MKINDAAGLDPRYDEILNRQEEDKVMANDERNELIGKKTEEFFEDPGTFNEFIQGIEIGEDDSVFFGDLHRNLIAPLQDELRAAAAFKARFRILYWKDCEKLAIEEIDDAI